MRFFRLALPLLLGACAATEQSLPPNLIALDSTALIESDDAPFDRQVGTIARSAGGELFVADFATRSVQVFGPDGRHRRTIGRGGSGPGEFETPSGLDLLDDDRVLAVADPNRGMLILFESTSGLLLEEIPYPGGAIALGNWAERDGTVIIPVAGQPAPFVSWNRSTDAMAPLGEMPPEWAGSPGISLSHGFPGVVAGKGSEWLALLQLVPGVAHLDEAGARTTVTPLPAVRRRGAPAGAAQAVIDAAQRGERRDGQPVASLTLGIHRRSDGAIVVIHLDPVLTRGSAGLEAVSQRYFVSLLRPDLAAACVDGERPITPDDLAIPTFSGDTLFFVEQRTTAAGDVERWIRSFLVDASACTWLPTKDVAEATP